jgi:hypothetical protein
MMHIWNDVKGDDPALHGRRLLLITQPQMYDAAQADIYDIVVGYWHKGKRAFVAADSPATCENGQTLRAYKWAELPDHLFVTLRPQNFI